MNELYIDDGYTATRTIPAVPGLLPALVVRYRPALAKARLELRAVMDGRDADAIIKKENDLIGKHVVDVNGAKLDSDKLSRLKPAMRTNLLDLILGYAAEDEGDDAKNS